MSYISKYVQSDNVLYAGTEFGVFLQALADTSSTREESRVLTLINFLLPRKEKSAALFKLAFDSNINPLESLLTMLKGNDHFEHYNTQLESMLILNFKNVYKALQKTLIHFGKDKEILKTFTLDKVESRTADITGVSSPVLKSYLENIKVKEDKLECHLCVYLVQSLAVMFEDALSRQLTSIIDFILSCFKKSTENMSDETKEELICNVAVEFIKSFRVTDVIYDGDSSGIDSVYYELVNFSSTITHDKAIEAAIMTHLKIKKKEKAA